MVLVGSESHYAVSHQNVGCVTSRSIVLLVRVVHELEGPFKPACHVRASAGVESIYKSAENLLKLRHGTGQGGETLVGSCIVVELDNTDEIGKRGSIEHGLRCSLEHVDAVVSGHAARGIQDQDHVLGSGGTSHEPGANACIVGGATRVLADVLVPDDAREVDQDPVLRPVKEPFRVAQLNHAAVQTCQVGVDVFRFARGAFHGVAARAQLRGGLDDAVPRVNRPALVAPAASGVAIVKVAKRVTQFGAARGVHLARRVIQVDVSRGGLEARLEVAHRILLVVQSGVEIFPSRR